MPGGGLIAAPDPFVVGTREVIMRSAADHRVPTVYTLRQAAAECALMSYGPDASDIFRRSASYVDRILKGAACTSRNASMTCAGGSTFCSCTWVICTPAPALDVQLAGRGRIAKRSQWRPRA